MCCPSKWQCGRHNVDRTMFCPYNILDIGGGLSTRPRLYYCHSRARRESIFPRIISLFSLRALFKWHKPLQNNCLRQNGFVTPKFIYVQTRISLNGKKKRQLMAHLHIISFMRAADSSKLKRPVRICPGVKIFTIIAMDKKTKQPQYTIHPLYMRP